MNISCSSVLSKCLFLRLGIVLTTLNYEATCLWRWIAFISSDKIDWPLYSSFGVSIPDRSLYHMSYAMTRAPKDGEKRRLRFLLLKWNCISTEAIWKINDCQGCTSPREAILLLILVEDQLQWAKYGLLLLIADLLRRIRRPSHSYLATSFVWTKQESWFIVSGLVIARLSTSVSSRLFE